MIVTRLIEVRMMRALRYVVGATGVIGAVTARAVVIGFDEVPLPNFDPYFGHTEKGFTFTITKGPWRYNKSAGRPKPMLMTDPFVSWTVVSQVVVTRWGGGLFAFRSADMYGDDNGAIFSFEGFRNGRSVFAQSKDYSRIWHTIASLHPDYVETLVITLDPDIINMNYMAMDNLDVQPVPEPSPAFELTALLLGSAHLSSRRGRERSAEKNPHRQARRSEG